MTSEGGAQLRVASSPRRGNLVAIAEMSELSLVAIYFCKINTILSAHVDHIFCSVHTRHTSVTSAAGEKSESSHQNFRYPAENLRNSVLLPQNTS